MFVFLSYSVCVVLGWSTCVLFPVDDELARLHKEYLSMSPDNFAKLFRPKAPMCNKILEFVIDDLHYFSYPVPCTEEASVEGSAAGGIGNPVRNSSSGSGAGGSKSDIISLFNVVIVTIKRSALVRVLQLKLLNLQALIGTAVDGGARGARVDMGLPGVGAILGGGGLRGAGAGVAGALESLNAEIVHELARLRCPDSVDLGAGRSGANPLNDLLGVLPQQHGGAGAGAAASPLSASAAGQLAFYAAQLDQLVAEHHSRVAEPTLRRVVEMFSKALFHQEKRQKYVTSQVALILKIQEKSAPSAGAKKPAREHGQESSVKAPPNTALALTSPGPGSALPGGGDTSDLDASSHGGSQSDAAASTPTKGGGSPHPLGTAAAATSSAATAGARATGGATSAQTPHYQELLESIMQQSSLANELRGLYHGLKSGHSVVLTINGYVALNMRLGQGPTQGPRDGHGGADGGSDGGRELQPYETLLLVADSETVMQTVLAMDASAAAGGAAVVGGAGGLGSPQQVPAGRGAGGRLHGHARRAPRAVAGAVAPVLEFVIMNADPTVSFAELAQSHLAASGAGSSASVEGAAQELQFRLQEVYAVARLLCSWGYARVLGTVTGASVYSVHPQAPLQASSMAAQTFVATFCADAEGAAGSGAQFARVLSLFSGLRPLREVLARLPEPLRPLGVDIVVFLLRWRLLREKVKFLVYIPDCASSPPDESLLAGAAGPVSAGCTRDRFILKKLRNDYFYTHVGDGGARRRVCRRRVLDICWREKLTEDELASAVALDSCFHLTQCAFSLE
jgi:hypothetical protein